MLCVAACAASPAPAPLPPAAPPAPAPPPSPAAPAADPEPPAEAQAKAAPPVEPAPPPAPAAPRLTSKGYVTWIYGRPKADRRYIGYVRYGTSVTLRSTEIVRGEGCGGGFYRVEPRGFVCRDRTVTLDPSPMFRDTAAPVVAAKGPFPFRYAISKGAPLYNRVPTAAEQKRIEARYGRADKWLPLPKSLAAHEALAVNDPIPPSDPIPPYLLSGGLVAEGRRGLLRESIPLGSMLAFTRAFDVEGRTFLLGADQSVVPADRMRIFKPSAFHGTRLGGDVDLPIAWMRATDKPRYRILPSGEPEKTGSSWPARTFARLTGASVEYRGARYLETHDKDADGKPLFVAAADATVPEAVKKLPTGVTPGQKFIVVRITEGTLVAYEGMKPVYATLMSPGAGGVPVKGRDPVKDSTTPLGTYNITFKDKAATMSPEKGENRSFWIADVPHTQYFNAPFALHAAYWHERFGEPTSAGCVNVSPIDAEVLFEWSDPPVPAEWQGATGAGAPENGGMTAVVVRR